MNLGRKQTLCAVLLVSTAMGCAGGAAVAQPQAPSEPPVATTELMAADLTASEEAPRVGKAQRFEAIDGEATGKGDDAPHRHGDHRRGGGFSGYK